jgi:hypothetical protein
MSNQIVDSTNSNYVLYWLDQATSNNSNSTLANFGNFNNGLAYRQGNKIIYQLGPMNITVTTAIPLITVPIVGPQIALVTGKFAIANTTTGGTVSTTYQIGIVTWAVFQTGQYTAPNVAVLTSASPILELNTLGSTFTYTPVAGTAPVVGPPAVAAVAPREQFTLTFPSAAPTTPVILTAEFEVLYSNSALNLPGIT